MPSFRDMVMELLVGRSHGGQGPEPIDIDFERLTERLEAPEPVVPREGMWKQSSFDLLNGLEVSEEPMETMPDELIEAFFKH